MQITVFGIFFIIILVILIFLPIKYTIGTLIISSVFQAASVINVSSKGIYAYLLLEIFLIFRYLIMNKEINITNNNEFFKKKFISRLFLFLFVSIFITIISSILFNDLSIDNRYLNNQIVFKLTPSTFVRIIVLFTNVTTLLIIYNLQNYYENNFIEKSIIFAIIIVLVFGFWGFIWKISNKAIYYPVNFLYSNIGYAQGYDQSYRESGSNFGRVRINSTFTEPSYCGGFLVAAFFGVLALNQQKKKYMKTLLFLLLAIIFNLSGTGIVTFIIALFVYFCLNEKDSIKTTSILKVIIFLTFTVIVITSTGYTSRLQNLLLNKLDSMSGVKRLYIDKKALEIFKKTFFLGGGVTCYRASSLFFTMLGSVGLLGSFLFFKSIIYFLHNSKKNISSPLMYYGYFYVCVVLISMFLSIPDIVFPPLWAGFIVLICVKDEKAS